MSKQQSKTAFSSTHTKYVAAAKASKEIIWLRHLLVELHEDVLDPTELYIYNRAVDLLMQNPVNHAAMKHIDVHYHFIRDCIMDRSINLKLISMNNMAADVMTKALATSKHKQFCQMLGMEMMP